MWRQRRGGGPEKDSKTHMSCPYKNCRSTTVAPCPRGAKLSKLTGSDCYWFRYMMHSRTCKKMEGSQRLAASKTRQREDDIRLQVPKGVHRERPCYIWGEG